MRPINGTRIHKWRRTLLDDVKVRWFSCRNSVYHDPKIIESCRCPSVLWTVQTRSRSISRLGDVEPMFWLNEDPTESIKKSNAGGDADGLRASRQKRSTIKLMFADRDGLSRKG